jgi:hypothetical protein
MPGQLRRANNILLFLHIDTQLPDDADQLIIQGLGSAERCWGRFDVRLSGKQVAFRVIETLMNWRSRLTGIATGDQAIFVKRDVFVAARGVCRCASDGGYPAEQNAEEIQPSTEP